MVSIYLVFRVELGAKIKILWRLKESVVEFLLSVKLRACLKIDRIKKPRLNGISSLGFMYI